MKKILAIVTLFITLVGSVFAVDWKKYGTYKDEIGVYELYFDFDATEPFELEKEDIRYIMNLLLYYNDVTITWSKYYDDDIYSEGAKHNCYSTLLLYEDRAVEYHVNNDGTCTIYYYFFSNNGKTIDDIILYASIDAFEKPWVKTEEE